MRISDCFPRCCLVKMELLPLVMFTFLFVPTLCEDSSGAGVRVVVEEDSDAVLPCSLSTQESIVAKVFNWRKDGQKEVFFYDSGIHSNNGRTGQDEQFRGRVSHDQDQLMNGNASIKIHNTKVADSGIYSCIFPHLHPRQTFYIELVVERLLRDRSGEIPGASKPSITTLDATKFWSLLQCEVQGASPEPKVQLQDGSGNILPAEERRGRDYVTLNITVTKTDHYLCVLTQEEISHQSRAETFVFISGAGNTTDGNAGVVIGVAVGVVVAVVVGVVVLLKLGQIKICKKMLSGPTGPEAEQNSDGPDEGPLKTPETNNSHSAAQNVLLTFTKASEPEDMC